MLRKRLPGKNKAGFTLIEIMMFIVLAGIVLSPLIGPFVTSVLQSDQPEIVISAVFLASERLEQLHPLNYTDPNLSVGTHNDGSITLGSNVFSRQYIVTQVDANLAVSASDVGYKRVVVTVFHSRLPAAGISLTSLLTNYAG